MLCTNMSWVFLKTIFLISFSRFLHGYYIRNKGTKQFHHGNVDQFNKNLQKLFSGRSMYQGDAPLDNVCCANGKWEASVYVNAGSRMQFGNGTFYAYYNGTGRIAFDSVNKKSYLSYSVTAYMPIVPVSYQLTSTVIKDFAAGIKYEIDEHDKCSKENNGAGMEIVCIPENGKLISEGVFGQASVSTYQFSAFDQLEEITTATVLRNGSYCETVMLSYALISDDVPEGLLYNVDIVDLTPGVKDPSVFVPPKSCNSGLTPE